MFKHFETILLLSTIYHSQTNEQSKKINQTIEIALRYFVTKFSKNDGIATLSLIQNQLNNSSSANTELILNEICYDFKTKNVFATIIFEKTKKELIEEKKFIDEKKLKKTLNKTRFRIRQKTIDAIFFANTKAKLIYDKRHKSFMLKSENKTFFIFNKEYKLSNKINKKLSQQKNDFFVIKKKMKKITYELELFPSGKIHSIISIILLKSHKRENFYKKSKSNHSKSIEIEKNIFHDKSYEVEKIVDKRIRKFVNSKKLKQYNIGSNEKNTISNETNEEIFSNGKIAGSLMGS